MIYYLAETVEGQEGGSRAAADILHHLLLTDHDVVVVSRNRRNGFRRPRVWRGPKLHWVMIPGTPPGRPGRSPRAWVWWLRAMARHRWREWRAARIPRRYPPTLAIHNECPYPGSYLHGLLHAAPRRVCIMHSSTDCIAHYLRGRKTLTVASVAAELEAMSGVVFVSPQLRDDWAAVADFAPRHTHVLSNTCREDEARAVLAQNRVALRASLGMPRDAFVAVCVGYVHDGKGQDVLVDAMPAMLMARPDLHVVCVGYNRNPWAAELAQRVEAMGLSEHVRFTGNRTDPYAWIRAADLLIHPSRTEGQGMVVLEAMLLGTPVLASDVGGIPSMVRHGETGYLVPPGDPAALAAGFRCVAENAAMRRAFAERAAERYRTHFSRREHAAMVREIVRAALDRR